ncbi:MAG: hypothetical protein IKZ87_02835 [Actinomycetaceae bacterium]|nr:hypothetical protein [Actinomycetaceae bacterium]
MQLLTDYRVYWRDATTVQIGLDHRTALTVEGLSPDEQELISRLTESRTHVDMKSYAHTAGIDPQRLSQIIYMLKDAQVINEHEHSNSSALSQPAMLSRSGDRSATTVLITSIDALGVSIAMALVRAGVGGIVFSDTDLVSTSDHPALQKHWLGLPRSHAFVTALRSIRSDIRTTGNPDFAVVTGSQLVDPFSASWLMDEGIPHLLAWAEEVDVLVGPLVQPGRTPCASCLYKYRNSRDEAWALLAPQALASTALLPPAETLDIASALGARAVLAYLDGLGNPIDQQQWRVPPSPDLPRLFPVYPNSQCGCCETLPPEEV